ncbi:hypothetical protein FZEAL_5573 [Fusarium zealandicum]|uniref:Uncharacterized protein n=1 Tax=Fusarium zealandicum TaxID=1053134 RepID=A0A8H4UKI1_9HYPO|nr:hypothetical protein FZEAL_5573 [Fusarium zealandicum]
MDEATSTTDTAQSIGSPKPIVIPSLSTKSGSPFLRAYAPDLEHRGISRNDFHTFLDRLNAVAAPNQVLTGIGYSGAVTGMAPEPTAQIVGAVIEHGAEIAKEELSDLRTTLYLRTSNSELFGPRGLRAQVMKLDKLAELAGIPILRTDSEDKPKLDKGASLLDPLEDCQEIQGLSRQLRQLNALEPWIASLEVEEKPDETENAQDPPRRITKFIGAVDDWERNHDKKKMVKKRNKTLQKYTGRKQKLIESHQKDLLSLTKKEEQIDADGSESESTLVKKRAKLSGKRQKAIEEHEQKLLNIESERHKDDEEDKTMRKIKYLVISNT